jgi:bifunctional DNase/RNase
MTHLPIRALPVVLLGAALVVGGASAGPRSDGTERVELEVAGLLPIGEGAGAVLVLREKGTRTILPLVLPAARAGEGEYELRGPGLLAQVIEALGGRVSEVEIEHAEESRTGAKVRLAQGGRSLELLGPPSESVALAISAKVPIVTRRRVLEEAGLTPEDLAKVHGRAKRSERRL